MADRDLLENLVGLYEAGRVMGSTLEGPEIGDRVLQILGRALETRAGAVHLYEKTGKLRMLSSENFEGCLVNPGVEAETERRRYAAVRNAESISISVDDGIRARYLPLRAQSGVVGLIELYHPPIDEPEEEFLRSLCIQAALALDNSRLYSEVLDKEQSLQSLVDRMVRVQEDERWRVAHEIHDGLTQTLVAINHHLEAFGRDFTRESGEEHERLERLLALSRGAAEEAQRIAFGLRPTVLEDFGVSAAIRSDIETLREQGIQVAYAEELNGEKLPEAVETTLYRIAQESLSNVRKHAGVEAARVELTKAGEEVRLKVIDRGRGFVPDETHSRGLGLLGMQERSELVGGDFEVRSSFGSGTEIEVAIPLASTRWDDVG